MSERKTSLMGWLPALLLSAALVPAARAAVPHEDAVPAYAQEQTILQREKDLPEPGWLSPQSGRRHLERNYLGKIGRDTEQDLILQRGGNTWRTLRNGPLATASAAILLLTLLGIGLVWKVVGPSRTGEPETGQRIQRFSHWQRLVHWTVAIVFVVLALTGIVILFGKQLLIPLIGHTAFSWLAIVSKYAHNIAGPLFMVVSLVMFFVFLRHNHFARGDWNWLRRGGRLEGGGHAPAGYFNTGEKLWFWTGVVLLGLLMSVTGLVLDFPYLSTRYLLQWANYLHLAGATFYIALAFGHVYMGTVGTPGAYTAMRHGYVDESWARTHHSRWYAAVKAREDADHALPAPGAGLREGRT